MFSSTKQLVSSLTKSNTCLCVARNHASLGYKDPLLAKEQFYNYDDGSTYSIMESSNTDWSVILTSSNYLPETISNKKESDMVVCEENRLLLKELFAQLLLHPPTKENVFSKRTGNLTGICKKTKKNISQGKERLLMLVFNYLSLFSLHLEEKR